MQTGIIPPNANFKTPHKDVEALQKGRIVVVSEPTPWQGGYVGISSFGFGGSNAHIIMKSLDKEKIHNGAPNDDLPRLVVVSGRTNEAVETIFNDASIFHLYRRSFVTIEISLVSNSLKADHWTRNTLDCFMKFLKRIYSFIGTEGI